MRIPASAHHRATTRWRRPSRRPNRRRLPRPPPPASPTDSFRDEYSGMKNLRPFLAATGIALLAGACATPRFQVPQPLPPPASSSQSEVTFDQVDGSSNQAPLGLQRSGTPQIPGSGGSLVSGAQGEPMPPLKG